MNHIYKELFSSTIKHAYHTNGYSNDFSIQPTPACSMLLNKYGLIYKNTTNGFTILCPLLLDDNNEPEEPCKPFKAFDNVLSFEFELRLTNPLFSNYTDISDAQKQKSIYYFSNNEDTKELSKQNILLKSSLLKYDLTSDTNSLIDAVIINENNDTVYKIRLEELEISKKNFSLQANLKGHNQGIYKLKIASESIEEKYFVSDNYIKKAVFGIIKIASTNDYAFDLSNPVAYEISFDIVSKQWKYYIKSKSTFSDLKIEDSAEIPVYHFTEESSSPIENTRLFKSIVGPDGANDSDKEWPFSEELKVELQLKDGDTILIDKLSIPSIDNPKAELFISI